MAANERVLLVDDDPNVLKAYERRLRRKFDVETALCSEEGVTAVNFLGPFAVVVSDMAMPREDGAEFLARMHDLSPDCVRIMLTGNADQATAVRAVNEAHVFKFLNKPCQADELERAIEEGIEEHRLRLAERDLMSQTVRGVVTMLTRVLSMVSPTAFGRATRLRQLAREVAQAAEIDDVWELEIAAALSQLGSVTLTEATLEKLAAGHPVAGAEADQVARQYEVAASLIGETPRLERIARVVALQSQQPAADEKPSVRRNAELIRAVLAFDDRVHGLGESHAEAAQRLSEGVDGLNPDAVSALLKVVAKRDARRIVELAIDELRDGLQLIDDVRTETGTVLVSKGHEVTPSLRQRLVNYAATHSLALPIRALAPVDVADQIESARAVAS